ncbi:hypothetical protein, partial [Sutterella wadsworthensis]
EANMVGEESKYSNPSRFEEFLVFHKDQYKSETTSLLVNSIVAPPPPTNFPYRHLADHCHVQ